METGNSHHVFISWSGHTSNKFAHALRDWISIVIQNSNPFMSESDIEPGSRSMSKLAGELEEVKVGLLCITPDNQDSRWLNFEAGAISKQIEESRVIPILFDLEPGQLKAPLSLFQAVKIDNRESMKNVANVINQSFGSQSIQANTLERSFEIAWQDLQKKIDRIRTDIQSETQVVAPKRTNEDMFEEIVVSLRDIRGEIVDISSDSRPSDFSRVQIELANRAIREVSATFGRTDVRDAATLASLSAYFSDSDWRTIDTAPFLRWYLEVFHNILQPTSNPRSIESAIVNDDVPF